jgi:hypothetical protein
MLSSAGTRFGIVVFRDLLRGNLSSGDDMGNLDGEELLFALY